MSNKNYKAGEIIIRQGDIGDSAYIIESGRVEVLIEKDDGSVTKVGTRGEGTLIGEMAIIDQAPRTATVKALEDCTLLEISAKNFTQRLGEADPILRMTVQVILTRYRDLLARIRHENTLPAELQELNFANEINAFEGLKIADEFKDALGTDQLMLYYQPIVNLSDGSIAGFEALMRWIHPERGFVPPDVFIPVIEDTDLMLEASRWALEEACKALRRIERHAGYKNELFMSVNFTARDFTSDHFLSDVYRVMSDSDITPNQLHIEITERLLMRQPEKAKETLQQCTDAGINISVDDFGTGYSSLSYLHNFPIDTLKIDRAFVMNMLEDKGSMELVRSIVGLAKNLGMDIIAEGVETEEEGKALLALECEMAQGYFFARPMPENEVSEFVRTGREKDKVAQA